MSKIPWTQKTWNPVTGCTKIASGCANCYSEVMHNRLRRMGSKKYQHDFSEVVCHPEVLNEPSHWRKPRMIFVNSMSDLFHEDVPLDFIHRVHGVMNLEKHHIFQILTKRIKRAKIIYDKFIDMEVSNPGSADYFGIGIDTRFRGGNPYPTEYYVKNKDKYMYKCSVGGMELEVLDGIIREFGFPLKNVWLGFSASNPPELEEGIKYLRDTLAVRFLSLEPLLENIILPTEYDRIIGINWVIVGAESKGAYPGRPCELEWVRSIVEQCKAAGVACFVKQLHIDGKLIKDVSLFPADLQIQEYPEV